MPRLLKMVAPLLLILGTWGCLKETGKPIRIGINPWPGYEFLFLADEMGFFRDEGVAVKLVEFNSLSDVARAFERGQVDGMASTMIEVVQVDQRTERAPRVFLVTDFSNGGDVLVASAGVRGLRDLAGKRVAVDPASLSTYIVARALDAAGLGLDDVTLVAMDQALVARAIKTGEVDAVSTYPPFSFDILSADGPHVIFSSAQIPDEVLNVVSLAQSVIDARAPEVTGIIRAWDRALAYARSNPDEAHDFMARREGITIAQLREGMRGLKLMSSRDQAALFADPGPIDRVARRVVDVLRATGQIEGGPAGTQLVSRAPIRALGGD